MRIFDDHGDMAVLEKTVADHVELAVKKNFLARLGGIFPEGDEVALAELLPDFGPSRRRPFAVGAGLYRLYFSGRGA